MRSFVRRLFPKYPVVGITLLLLLVIEASAWATTIIGNGHAYEGAWHVTPTSLPDMQPYCSYVHAADTANITDELTDPFVGVDYNYHRHYCIGYTNAQGGCDPIPTSCSGTLNQNHYSQF